MCVENQPSFLPSSLSLSFFFFLIWFGVTLILTPDPFFSMRNLPTKTCFWGPTVVETGTFPLY